ncbi:MAG: hypothetical protein JNK29_12170 [Anaerolineales bacterium]|nr:hypothetical protein [Anaerolineales bacterium]
MRRWINALLALALLLGAMPAQAQTAPPDLRFGAVEAYMAPDRAAELRVGWDRMVVRWHERQPDSPDQWNVPGEEGQRVDAALAAGRETVMLLMGTPAWATDGAPLGGVPRGLYLPVDDPGNLWAAFVRRMVSEYAGRVNHWIIWNEPDIAPEDFGAQFIGSVQDYYQLLKIAYQAAKRANPQAVIHLAGMTHWHDVVHNRPSYLLRLLQTASKDPTARRNNYYFDVATLHIYFRTDSVFDLITLYYGTLRRFGLRQPIWLNETNAAPYDDPQLPWEGPMFRLTMDQQAGFVVQATALALAAGAERVAIYKLTNPDVPYAGADYYGLYRPDGSSRPAVEAFRLVTTHFAGVRRTTYVAQRSHYIVRLERPGAVTRVLWARQAQAVTVRVRATAGTTAVALYDPSGAAYPVAADRNGNYTLTLPAALCPEAAAGCVVGGTPWVLVETLGRR